MKIPFAFLKRLGKKSFEAAVARKVEKGLAMLQAKHEHEMLELRHILRLRRDEVSYLPLPAAINRLVDDLEQKEQNFDRLCRVLREILYKAQRQPEWEENVPYPIHPNDFSEATGLLARVAGHPREVVR